MEATLQRNKLNIFLDNIKFAHSVFALPFALIAMLLAAGGVPGFWTFFWIVIAAVAARTAAMSFNRLADVRYDARNPRTASRPLVTGELNTRDVTIALAISSLVFIFASLMLNRTCFYLSTPVLAVLFGYSMTKRFTRNAHFFLGIALGLAPLGAWVAVREELAWTPLWLALAVMCWVAGFDILYSCQDYQVDVEEEDLHSIPKSIGIAGAMNFARRTHALSVIFFLFFWWASGLGLLSLLGICGIGFMLDYQHRLVRPDDLSRIDAAFFTANGIISIGFFLIVSLDVLAI